MTEQQQTNIAKAYKIIRAFCEKNKIKEPKILIIDKKSRNGYCGLYDGTVKVWVKSCANVAKTPGFSWSHPGYFVDRTVFGVLLHEFGHYVHSKVHNVAIPAVGKITSYEPNKNERFAETMKVFLSNPDLLKQYNPKRYNALIKLGLKPVINKSWEEVLADAHPKYIEACRKRIKD